MPSDRFGAILAQTNSHRAHHGCGAYPFDDGSLPGAVAAAACWLLVTVILTG
jgi:hypothetical protein